MSMIIGWLIAIGELRIARFQGKTKPRGEDAAEIVGDPDFL
jgi:hypothetical protein